MYLENTLTSLSDYLPLKFRHSLLRSCILALSLEEQKQGRVTSSPLRQKRNSLYNYLLAGVPGVARVTTVLVGGECARENVGIVNPVKTSLRMC